MQQKLHTEIKKCQTPDLVLVFNHPIEEPMLPRSNESNPVTTYNVFITVSDLMKLLGHSIWKNAVVVQPFDGNYICEPLGDYKLFLKEDSIKPKYEWSDIDPELTSSIPTVPIAIGLSGAF